MGFRSRAAIVFVMLACAGSAQALPEPRAASHVVGPDVGTRTTVELAKRKPRKKKPRKKTAADKAAAEQAAAEQAAAEQAAAEQAAAEQAAAEQAAAEQAAAEQAAAEQAAAEQAAAEQAAAEQAAAEQAAAEQAQTARVAAEAKGLDARVRRLTDQLALGLKRVPGDVREQTFAVLPFSEQGEGAKAQQLGLVVSDLVMTNLVRDHRLSLTERGQLQAIVEEQALSASGAIDPSHAPRVGQLTGAQALVLGEITETADTFEVTARIVDAQSASILAAERAALPKAELVALAADAVVLRSKAGAAFRSLVAPGWGQLYNGEPVKAGLFMGGAGLLAAATAVTLGSAALTHYSYQQWTPSQPGYEGFTQKQLAAAVSGLRETANVQYSAAVALAGVTAAVVLLGVVDAYESGTDVESLDAARAKN